jgi:tetratricopeptide (TPR) repeat protein
LRQAAGFAILIIACPAFLTAQNNPVSIGQSETLFTVLAAINNCGYDAELGASDPQRQTIRDEIGRQVESSDAAKDAASSLCGFYRDHLLADDTHTLAQYVSLALYLDPPPAFAPKVKEADLPPDASAVLGLVPLLAKFYTQVGTHEVWQAHQKEYADLSGRYRDALAAMIRDTELYLRLPSGSYGGRTFTIFLEPLGAPSEVNARSYGDNYYVVITPGAKVALKMDQIHHAYLHYLVDPLVGRYAGNLTALTPLLDSVKLAPMDESFKGDVVLLTTECVIRALEARTSANGKAPLSEQEHAVEQSMSQGFILTRYFYENLQQFEKGDVGFRNAVGLMIARIDVHKEQKRAGQVQFAAAADPELLQLARPKQGRLLIAAQERLSAGDPEGAEKLAKQALAEKSEDPGRALFILAQVSLKGNMDGAKQYFEQALRSTTDPTVVAWSHIYLGRILDLQDHQENGPDRASAVEHYKAAVEASDTLPEAKAAGEQGMQKAYEPPKSSKGQARDTDNSDSPSQ